MRGAWSIVAACGMLVTPAGATAWDEVASRDIPGGIVAECLRAHADGAISTLGPLSKRTVGYDVLRARNDRLRLSRRFQMPQTFECPSIAVNGKRALVAGAARGGGVQARFFDGKRVRRLRLGPARPSGASVAAALGPDGSAVVAWAHLGRRPRGFSDVRRGRVLARRISAEGELGQLRELAGWRRGGGFSGVSVTVAMDADGVTTVAWSQAVPDRGKIPNLTPELNDVGVATLGTGGELKRQVLARNVQGVDRPALAVAADGSAVLAYEGNGRMHVWDQPAGSARFALVNEFGGIRREARDPSLAIRDGGGAVLAWRLNSAYERGQEGIQIRERLRSGRFGPPRDVLRRYRGAGDGGAFAFALFSNGHGVAPPSDEDQDGPSAALGADGSWLVAWLDENRSPFGDRPTAPYAATGRLQRELGRPRRLGCGCRDAHRVVALSPRHAAFADNASRLLGLFRSSLEYPSRDGRVHLVDARAPAALKRRPEVAVSVPSQSLRHGRALKATVACDRACDLRALVRHDGRIRALAVRTLRRRGQTELRLEPTFADAVPAPGSAQETLVVRGWPLGGGGTPTLEVSRPSLTLIPPRPVPRPLDVRADRSGRKVTVSWRIARPVPKLGFQVILSPIPRRHRLFPRHLVRTVPARGRRSFSITLRLKAGDAPRRATVYAQSHVAPYRTKEVRVPVVRR